VWLVALGAVPAAMLGITVARRMVDEKRLRIWRTYLAGCAHAFAQGWVSIQQVLAVKTADPRVNPLPWTRDYMYTR
jgi:cyclopropane-fatty-acyl-phospholipid synthase